MSENWKKATKLYRVRCIESYTAENFRLKRRDYTGDNGLIEFLSSEEGEQALTLLGTVQKRILFGTEDMENERWEYFLDGRGLILRKTSRDGLPRVEEELTCPAKVMLVFDQKFLATPKPADRILRFVRMKLNAFSEDILFGNFHELSGAPTRKD
ncbi:MAG: hypothetical protein WCP15_00045 [bacterium]